MDNVKHLPNEHAVGKTLTGRPFVFCPVGNIFSWHPADAENRWCPWCHKGFELLEK